MKMCIYLLFTIFALSLGACAGNSSESQDSSSKSSPVSGGGGGNGGGGSAPSVSNVSGLYASPNNFQITLRWVNPVAANLLGVRVVRKTGSFPTGPTDGTIVSSSLTTSATDTGLANGTQYYYKIFAYDTSFNFASGVQVRAIPYTSGTAVLSSTLTSGSSASYFYAVVPDASGNVYAVGYQTGTGTYSYASGVSATGTNSNGSQYNPVIVKYNMNGVAQWARTISSGFGDAQFFAVTVDSTGNPVAAGFQTGNSVFGYGATNVTGASSGYNAVIVKFDSNGGVVWAKSTTLGSSNSGFSAITADANGNLYAAGYQTNFGTYSYVSGVNATGSASGKNAVLVKYNSSGVAQWAKTTSSGPAQSEYLGIAIDAAGSLFLAGYLVGNSTYNFGAGVTATAGTSSDNSLLVKYDSAGIAQWARTVVTGSSNSHYNAVIPDSDGNLYCAGYQTGTASFAYGVGVATGASSSTSNAVIIKYSFDGNAQWVRSMLSGSGSSGFFSIATDFGGNLYAVGYQNSTVSYNYYSGVSLLGTSTSANPVIVRFSSTGFAQWGQTMTGGTSSAAFNYVASDTSGNLFVVGYQGSTGTVTYGVGVNATGPSFSNNASFLKYVQ